MNGFHLFKRLISDNKTLEKFNRTSTEIYSIASS